MGFYGSSSYIIDYEQIINEDQKNRNQTKDQMST